ncbi:uncharacterized protein HD556DRAFT_1498013 [Suillus plorans]|uniref:Uncharacterized protein n=1 Tax=Suillus plorans TaxID=116603 RepID=A0A9P7J3W1_9AGAM|nr:uncharacterized protein HD556DRAFT_1498013 [Suillus plorans]KAG1801457.1 hypothetical protein HD556DRAFT_1498013 [Suillus plorans]
MNTPLFEWTKHISKEQSGTHTIGILPFVEQNAETLHSIIQMRCDSSPGKSALTSSRQISLTNLTGKDTSEIAPRLRIVKKTRTFQGNIGAHNFLNVMATLLATPHHIAHGRMMIGQISKRRNIDKSFARKADSMSQECFKLTLADDIGRKQRGANHSTQQEHQSCNRSDWPIDILDALFSRLASPNGWMVSTVEDVTVYGPVL